VGIPPAPRGVPQVEVSFDIDANGIINVSAKDNATGNEQQIRIEGGSGLKPDEVDRMIKEAEAHSEEASKLRELVDTRNNAESLAYQVEKSLQENREKIDESIASTVEGRIMELRGVLESSDVAEIKAKTDALQEAWTQAASALYAQASSEQPSGNGGSTDSAASDDEVVEDAEYEVVDDK
jgi:molecular chaperone DnaK